MTKYVVLEKNNEQKVSKSAKCEKPETFDVWFCVFFDCYCQKLSFKENTEH